MAKTNTNMTVNVGLGITGKSVWKSKKFWTAIVTVAASAVAYFTDNEPLAKLITFCGMTLIAGFGLADSGKEAKLVDVASKALDAAKPGDKEQP